MAVSAAMLALPWENGWLGFILDGEPPVPSALSAKVIEPDAAYVAMAAAQDEAQVLDAAADGAERALLDLGLVEENFKATATALRQRNPTRRRLSQE